MPIDPKSVIGILVTYQPDEAVFQRIEAHRNQLSQLIVIDNGVASPDKRLPKDALAHLENNLAAAQNTGIRKAKEQGAQAVLLLDDDSEMGNGMLAALCKAYEDGDGLLAPQPFEAGTPVKQVFPWLGIGFKRAYARQDDVLSGSFTPIASGCLIPIETFEHVGLLDESFNIDYLDRDHCLRLLTRGYRIKLVGNAKLQHRLGTSEHRGAFPIRHHSPARRYTIFRNRLRCWARHGLSVPSFLVYDTLAAAFDLARIALYEENKRAKFQAAFSGAFEAFYRRR